MKEETAFQLTDREIALLDDLIAMGVAPDREAALRRSLTTERRRLDGRRDAQIYARMRTESDLDDLATWLSAQPLNLD